MKKCKNCGNEMTTITDFANQDINSEYCKICLKQDGSLRTNEEFKEAMITHFLTEEGRKLTEQLGLDPAKTPEEARKLADWVMNTMAENRPELNK